MKTTYTPYNNNLLFSQDKRKFIDTRAAKHWEVVEGFPGETGEPAPFFITCRERLTARDNNSVVMAVYATERFAVETLGNLHSFISAGDVHLWKWPPDLSGSPFEDLADKNIAAAYPDNNTHQETGEMMGAGRGGYRGR